MVPTQGQPVEQQIQIARFAFSFTSNFQQYFPIAINQPNLQSGVGSPVRLTLEGRITLRLKAGRAGQGSIPAADSAGVNTEAATMASMALRAG